ncbi:hypothetical protein F4678DRAFT_484239 [Xylaria arbuscula]|nr:hypothetical protein F4678DRAFT_484239 [Xylaria arbuscula]
MSSGSTNPLDHIPAAMAPPGITSNLVDPPSKAHTLTVLDSVLFSIMAIAVLIRFYIRTKTTKNWGWDDSACVIAAVSSEYVDVPPVILNDHQLGSLSHTIIYAEGVKYGFGRHIWDIPASWLIDSHHLQLFASQGVTYPVTIFFTKLCILIFYMRVFGINRTLKWTATVMTTILALFYTAMIAIAIASLPLCVTVSDGQRPFCKYVSGPNVLVGGSFNGATDIALLLIPFPLLMKLKMGLRRKIRFSAVFIVGIAAVAASIARLVVFATNYHNPDNLWIQATNAMLTLDYVRTTTTTIKRRMLTPKNSMDHLTEVRGGSSGTLQARRSRSTEQKPNIHFEELDDIIDPSNKFKTLHQTETGL